MSIGMKMKSWVLAAMSLAAFAAVADEPVPPEVRILNVYTSFSVWTKPQFQYYTAYTDDAADYKIRFEVTLAGETQGFDTEPGKRESPYSYPEIQMIDTVELFGREVTDPKAVIKISLILVDGAEEPVVATVSTTFNHWSGKPVPPGPANLFYAAPEALVDPEDPNYCQLPECAGTLADAIAMAREGGNDVEIVLADGVYSDRINPEGYVIDNLHATIRSASGDKSKCVIDGGGDNGACRALFFPRADEFSGVSLGMQYTVKGITFRNFHLTHARDVNVVRKGGVICVLNGSDLIVEDCDFLDNACGILGADDSNYDLLSSRQNEKFSEFDPTYSEDKLAYGSGGVIYAYATLCMSESEAVPRGRLVCNRCRFIGNRSCGTGSAICSWKITTLDQCLFEDNLTSNTVSDVGYYAGTVAVYPANINGYILALGWASNCVFRGNYCYSGNEIRGGAVHNMNTYRCKFYNNGCGGKAAGWGGTIWGYNNVDKFTHIEDEVDNSDRPAEWSFHQSEFRGGKYYRSRFGGSNRVEAAQSILSGNLSSFYNCLFQDFYYHDYQPSRTINCTFARCRWGNHSWNGYFVNKCEMINTAMLDCESMNGCIVEWADGHFIYTSGNLTMKHSVYYAADEKHIHSDWSSRGDNTWYQPGMPGQEGRQYYSYINPASTTDPYRPARDCYLVDKGMMVEGMADKYSLMSRDLLGNPRCVGGAPDIGCYEYYIKPGISVMLR